ncbi:MAG: type II toxin-antitoxin system RelE/ParE family toxin [Bacteroidetes bacterium]|nr:type II toxin-antitoxin system RelE/ParE family toxin [Bacteroidota bacterium]MBS1930069.1 type II toxin-antitoxin system RelE/ParE family toxin [Bacteroidota bacterium]
MNFSIELSEEAREDVTLAVKWYDQQKENLGDFFITHLNSTLEKIRNNPASHKKIYRQVRQAAMQKFPYVILYKVKGNSITVYAVFHTKRNPKTKIRRLKK